VVGVPLLDANRCQEDRIAIRRVSCAVAANEALLPGAGFGSGLLATLAAAIVEDAPQQNASTLASHGLSLCGQSLLVR